MLISTKVATHNESPKGGCCDSAGAHDCGPRSDLVIRSGEQFWCMRNTLATALAQSFDLVVAVFSGAPFIGIKTGIPFRVRAMQAQTFAADDKIRASDPDSSCPFTDICFE